MIEFKGYIRGYPVIYKDDRWIYEDTGEPIGDKDRECIKCGEKPTEEGHDPCIPNLPGIRNACCGHGDECGSLSYFQFENQDIFRGEFKSIEETDLFKFIVFKLHSSLFGNEEIQEIPGIEGASSDGGYILFSDGRLIKGTFDLEVKNGKID